MRIDDWSSDVCSSDLNVLPLVEKYGDLAGTILAGMTMWLETLKIKVPFTMKHHPDNESLYRADIMPKPDYPKADGVLTFDRQTGRPSCRARVGQDGDIKVVGGCIKKKQQTNKKDK